jgi:hypothetical protein
MMKGHFAYSAVPTNTCRLSAFRYHTSIIWYRSLRPRSQRHRLTWERTFAARAAKHHFNYTVGIKTVGQARGARVR